MHTIVDEQLGTPENKAKLLISTFFILLLLGLARDSYDKSFEEPKLTGSRYL